MHRIPDRTPKTPALVLCELAATEDEAVDSHSPFCLKVIRALRAHGLSYTSLRAANPQAFRAHNATGQVPVLLVDGVAVPDSTAILRVIEEIAGVTPSPAEAWLWEELADTSLNGFVVAARWACDDNWSRTRFAYFGGAPWPVRACVAPLLRRGVVKNLVARDVWRGGAAACWSRLERLLDDLEARAPADGFWMGPRMTAADFGLFGQLQALRTPLTPVQAASVTRRVRLTRYLDRVDHASREVAPRAAGSRADEIRLAPAA